MINKSKAWMRENRLFMLYASIISIAVFFLYLYRLGSHIRGDSRYEKREFLNILSAEDLFKDVSLAPIRFFEMVLLKIEEPNSTLLRIISVFIVLLTIYAFYRLISKWHTPRTAVFATVLFATSSFSLHIGRFTSNDALYFLIFPMLLLFGTWLKSKKYVVRLPIILPAVALLLYVPGVIYLYFLLAVVFHKRLLLAWRFVDVRKNAVSLAASTLLLVPLVYSLVVYPDQLHRYFAFDRLTGENGLRTSLNTLADLPSVIFYNGLTEPHRWLTGTPVLDVASAVLLLLGAYAYFRGPHTLRARTIFAFLILSVVLISISTVAAIALIVPLLYIIIAYGIVFLLQSWFTVFPRNPAAKNIALTIMVVFIALICSYHLQRYFLAWPNDPDTKSALSAEVE